MLPTKHLKLSWNGTECKPLLYGRAAAAVDSWSAAHSRCADLLSSAASGFDRVPLLDAPENFGALAALYPTLPALARDAQAREVLSMKTSTRSTLHRRAQSTHLYEHSPEGKSCTELSAERQVAPSVDTGCNAPVCSSLILDLGRGLVRTDPAARPRSWTEP
jgi:hypothetical protein